MALTDSWAWPVLKAALSAALIGAITLVGRRWGAHAAGIVAGLPLTSAPVSAFLALEQGPAFAADAAVGSLRGITPSIAFLAVYAWRAPRDPWPKALAAACVPLALLPALDLWRPALVPATLLAAAALTLAVATLQAPPRGAARRHAPRWEIPARTLTVAALVLTLTAAAGFLGPDRAGMLSPLPVFGAVLATFTHAHDGPDAARALIRASLVSITSFIAFFAVLPVAIAHAAAAPAYLAATGVALAASAAAWLAARPRRAVTAAALPP